jgi:hypothetical protein
MNTLIQIGVYFLYLLAGTLFSNALLHLIWSFHFTRLPERHKNSFMGSRWGTTISGLIYLFIGFLILALLKYQFGLNLDSLLIFLGFSLIAFSFTVRFNAAEKKNS